jgi:hypothetical protein
MADGTYSEGITLQATVGGGSNAPYMIAVFSTPNNDNSNDPGVGPGVMPEPATPNNSGTFPPCDQSHDGWKMVKFYVMTADNSPTFQANINGVSVQVNYPDGSEKFQLNASHQLDGSWSAAQVYPATEYYPSEPFLSGVNGPQATPPVWTVRVLTPAFLSTPAHDMVDEAADGNPNPGLTSEADDKPLATALNDWGCLVAYGTNPYTHVAYDATTAGNQFNSNKALCLEFTGWIWYHQPAYNYQYFANAVTTTQSGNLDNVFHFIELVSLYTDYNVINWGAIPNSKINTAVMGDTDLSTPGEPTVWNNGNADAQLAVAATGLYLDGNPAYGEHGATPDPAKCITNFDATLAFKDDLGRDLQVGTINFSDGQSPEIITDSSGNPVILKLCHPAQIDFSLHSSNSYNVTGTYKGTITLIISVLPGSSDA